jgi:hypothetical protein
MSYIEVEEGSALYAEAVIPQPTMMVEGVAQEQPALHVGGTFIIEDGDIRLKLVRMDKYFHVGDETEHLVVRTEKNWTASLFDIVPSSSGQHGTKSAAYWQDILVNTAIVGWEEWKPEYHVRRTIFRVPGADHFLRHYPTYQGMTNKKFSEEKEHEALDAEVSFGRIRITYWANSTMDSDYARDVWPVVELQFTDEQSLEDMRHHVISFLRFLSCTASHRMTASEQTISRLDHDEWLDAVKARNAPVDYSVYYFEGDKPKKQNKRNEARIYGSFALLHDDEERDAFVDCLKAWFARERDWEGAASALIVAYNLDDEMSPTRLLNAVKWIEETPGTKAQRAIPKPDADKLTRVVVEEAKRLGYGDYTDAFRNMIGAIAKERHTVRFERLVAELKAQFGDQVVGDDLAAWVTKAVALRNPAAHGMILRQTDEEYEEFAKAVHAAECFAYLLLIRDLPMTKQGLTRAASSSLVEGYRVNIKGSMPKVVKKSA